MICNTETDLHVLIDSLTDVEHVKATWKAGNVEVTAEGPVYKDDLLCSCFHAIRWSDGDIDRTLTSIEVTREEEVTVTRDDEKALHALLDSLGNGETVTAEWRKKAGSMTLVGKVWTGCAYVEVRGYDTLVLRQLTGVLPRNLHSVTVRRTVVQRWEREVDA